MSRGRPVLVELPEEVARQRVEKLALTLREVEWVLGSPSLVRELRDVGVLVPVVKRRQSELFDAGDVESVWLRLRAGQLDEQLREWRAVAG